jgi:hypothetical protein
MRKSHRMESTAAIPDDRPLTDAEASLVRWLLSHGIPRAKDHLSQLDRARVVSRCYCGCASINFAIGGVVPPPADGTTSSGKVLAAKCSVYSFLSEPVYLLAWKFGRRMVSPRRHRCQVPMCCGQSVLQTFRTRGLRPHETMIRLATSSHRGAIPIHRCSQADVPARHQRPDGV